MTTPSGAWDQADRLMERAEGRHFRWWTERALRPTGVRTKRAWRRWASAWWVGLDALQLAARQEVERD